MNQAFEDLKQDIQNLIDTASDTIRQIVDDAASRAQGPLPGAATTIGSDGSEFTSQIEELRTKVRNAVDNLKQQAKSALSNPSFGGGSGDTGGSSSGSSGGGGVSAPEPKPGPASGVNEGTAASNNVDDQMPAGGSAQSPNTPVPPAPNFGGSTIGPDSFKSGA
jgi:hypothetical protein